MTESTIVPFEDAMKRLDVIPDYDAGNGEGPCVHTLAQSQIGLLGAHWYLPDVERLFIEHDVQEAGEQAQAMQHGLVVSYADARFPGGWRTLFFATKPDGSDHA